MRLPVLLATLALSALGVEPGFIPLFDGKSLDGWTLIGGKGPGYVVRDGMIVCPADGGGNLFTNREYANFVLRFDFRLEAGGNNGVAIRSPFKDKSLAYEGMEIQIIDGNHPKYAQRKQGPLKPTQHHGSVYDVIPSNGAELKPPSEWNTMEIVADARRVKVTTNGKVILDAMLDSVTDPEVLKKHPGLKRTTGRIGWLGHGALVEFRNVRIKEIR